MKRLWHSHIIEEKRTEIKYSLAHDRDEHEKEEPMQGSRPGEYFPLVTWKKKYVCAIILLLYKKMTKSENKHKCV